MECSFAGNAVPCLATDGRGGRGTRATFRADEGGGGNGDSRDDAGDADARPPRDHRVEEVPVPEPGLGELLIEVGACGICASDIKCFLRGPHFWGEDGAV